MTNETSSDTLNGLFKKVYGDLENLIPDNVKLTKEIPFVPQNKQIGESYNAAVVLKSVHGVTYAGTSGDAVDYNPAVPQATKQASITPAAMFLVDRVPYQALLRTQNLSEGAFEDATKHIVANMLQSAFNKYEQQCFYGGVGLATVDSVNTSTKVITITTADWAPGIWVGAEGMKLEAYDTTLASQRTGTMQITAVDIVNRTITVDAVATSLTGTDVLFEYGAKGNEFIGIDKMLSTTTGNIFNIATQSYSLWRGNQFAVGGAALTFKKVSQAVALATAKGVSGTLTLFVNPKTWSDLLTEQTAQRTFHEGSMAEYNNGAKKIMFYSQNGDIEIVASSFVKEGRAYALDLSTFLRIGSQDLTFEHPLKKGKFIEPLEGSTAAQIIAYCDSALFCSKLGHNIIFTGIVNS
jgi:hypothetical protein